jgi:ribosomal protein S4
LVARLAHAKSVKQARRIVSHDAAARRVGNEIDAALKTLRNLGYAAGH